MTPLMRLELLAVMHRETLICDDEVIRKLLSPNPTKKSTCINEPPSFK